MKFFTEEMCKTLNRDQGIRNLNAAWANYRNDIEVHREVLGSHLSTLALMNGMNDGLVCKVLHDQNKKILEILLRCGDLQVGYFDLHLKYIDAEITPEHEHILAHTARTTQNRRRVEAIYAHEVGISEDGRFEHRIIFESWIWLQINCRELKWQRVDRDNRTIPDSEERFPGYPEFQLYGVTEKFKIPYIAWQGCCDVSKCTMQWFGELTIENQEKKLYFHVSRYLKKLAWALVRYEPELNHDHEHCTFCWRKIATAGYDDPQSIQSAYLHRAADEYGFHTSWVCPACFEQLRKTFKWRIDEATSAEI